MLGGAELLDPALRPGPSEPTVGFVDGVEQLGVGLLELIDHAPVELRVAHRLLGHEQRMASLVEAGADARECVGRIAHGGGGAQLRLDGGDLVGQGEGLRHRDQLVDRGGAHHVARILDGVDVRGSERGHELVELVDPLLDALEARRWVLVRCRVGGRRLGGPLGLHLGLDLGQRRGGLLGAGDRIGIERQARLLELGDQLGDTSSRNPALLPYLRGGGLDLGSLRGGHGRAWREAGLLLLEAAALLDGAVERGGEGVDGLDPAGGVCLRRRGGLAGPVEGLRTRGGRRLRSRVLLACGGPALLHLRRRSFGRGPLPRTWVSTGGGEVVGRHDGLDVAGLDVEQVEHVGRQVEQHAVGFEQPLRTRDRAAGQAGDGFGEAAAPGLVQPRDHGDVRMEVDELLLGRGQLQEAHRRLGDLDVLDVALVAVVVIAGRRGTEAAGGGLGHGGKGADEALHGLRVVDELLGGVEQAARGLDHLAGGGLEVLEALLDLVVVVLSHRRPSPRR